MLTATVIRTPAALVLLIGIISMSGHGQTVALSNVAGKKLIRASEDIGSFWGAGSVADAELPAKIAALQEAGYEGLVFSLASNDKAKGYGVMTGQWWNCAVRRSYEEFLPEIEAFRAVQDWGRITDNFTRTMPAVWSDTPNIACQDWFRDEDWDVVLHNARVMVRVIRDCGFKGIMLDTEQYAHHARGPWRYPWNYKLYAESGYKLAAETEPRSFADVAAKVEERGRQYGEAITSVYPALTLMVIAGMYENAWTAIVARSPDQSLNNSSYGLYPAFLDGLLQGLDTRAKLVAGTERTYLDSQYKEMLVVRDAELRQAIGLSRYPDLAAQRLSFSVGIWTDAGWGPDRFSDTDVSVNQRDPERHLHAIHNALAASDEYAWQWGEMGGWLNPDPKPLIGEYWRANVEAHKPQNLLWAPEPRWDMSDYSAYDANNVVKDAAFWADAEKGGWRVAAELPEFWKFLFDTETLIRFRDYLSAQHDDRGWQLLSVLKCWQSQSVKCNGPAVYRTRFTAPADIDPKTREVVLAFAGFPPDNVKSTGWMDVRLNGKGYPIRHLIDVSDSIVPGGENHVAVRVINKSGPGGLTGHVKLLVRGGPEPAPAAPLLDGEQIFFEGFEGYEDGTMLSAAGWTTEVGDFKITRATAFGKSVPAIDGKTPTAVYGRGYKPFAAPVNQGDRVMLTAKVHASYGQSWTYVGLHTGGATGVMLGNNGWQWCLDARAIAGPDTPSAEFWPYSEADPWNNRELIARIWVDTKTHKIRATLTDAHGTVHESAAIEFAAGAETKLTGVIVYPTNTQAGRNMDIGEIRVERSAGRY